MRHNSKTSLEFDAWYDKNVHWSLFHVVDHDPRSQFTERAGYVKPDWLAGLFFACCVLSTNLSRLHVHLLLAERPDSVSSSTKRTTPRLSRAGWRCLIRTTVPSYLEEKKTTTIQTYTSSSLLSNWYRQIVENFKLSSAGEMSQKLDHVAYVILGKELEQELKLGTGTKTRNRNKNRATRYVDGTNVNTKCWLSQNKDRNPPHEESRTTEYHGVIRLGGPVKKSEHPWTFPTPDMHACAHSPQAHFPASLFLLSRSIAIGNRTNSIALAPVPDQLAAR